jgi:hypothetical protein
MEPDLRTMNFIHDTGEFKGKTKQIPVLRLGLSKSPKSDGSLVDQNDGAALRALGKGETSVFDSGGEDGLGVRFSLCRPKGPAGEVRVGVFCGVRWYGLHQRPRRH